MSETWTALVDPTRRAVLDVLLEGEQPVGEIVDRLRLSQPQASKHLRVLREAGPGHRCARTPSGGSTPSTRGPIADLDAWLSPYRRLWNDSLDRLEQHLEDQP